MGGFAIENANPQRGKHLWEITPVRDLAIIAVVVILAWLTYQARTITAPVLLGLVLAYIFHPVVGYLEKKKYPRWAGTGTILLGIVGLVLGFILAVVPIMVGQFASLLGKLPGYVVAISQRLDVDWKELIQKLQEAASSQIEGGVSASASKAGEIAGPVAATVAKIFAVMLSALNHVIDAITYLGLASFITGFCFFYFSWKWPAIVKWFDQFIYDSQRKKTYLVIGRMDRTISAFIRGRLIQSLIMGVILSVGWKFAGVPYWLLLGMGSGLLNLAPFLAVVGWVVALILAAVDQVAGGGSLSIWTFLWPTLVYGLAQGLDGWVIEPAVQGKATDLDPLTVLLAVLIGGTLAGLLGLLVAIPVTACIKILSQEVVLPKVREYVQSR